MKKRGIDRERHRERDVNREDERERGAGREAEKWCENEERKGWRE